MVRCSLFVSIAVCLTTSAWAVDGIVFERDGRQQRVEGERLVEAADGGMLLLAPDGVLWALQPDEIVRHESDDMPFRPMTHEQLAGSLIDELPSGFAVHTTAHYVICYNTSRPYALWVGSLFERLHRAFTNYWQRRGCELQEPQLPLPVLVFADAASYRGLAQKELGEAARSVAGYYSLRTNRVLTYDLTGVESLRSNGQDSSVGIQQILSRPAARPLVATIVHEATHQIAFNCGMHARYADVPLWVSEGVAIYFETPDLRSRKGWRGIGQLHRSRLSTFRSALPRRPAGSLAGLIADDKRLRQLDTAREAYAEAWALCYYLLGHHPEKFADYMKMLAKKVPLIRDDAATRLAEFRQFFGEDLDRLDAEFIRQMQRVR